MLLLFVIRLCYFLNFIVKQLSRIDWSISQFMTGIVKQNSLDVAVAASRLA